MVEIRNCLNRSTSLLKYHNDRIHNGPAHILAIDDELAIALDDAHNGTLLLQRAGSCVPPEQNSKRHIPRLATCRLSLADTLPVPLRSSAQLPMSPPFTSCRCNVNAPEATTELSHPQHPCTSCHQGNVRHLENDTCYIFTHVQHIQRAFFM